MRSIFKYFLNTISFITTNYELHIYVLGLRKVTDDQKTHKNPNLRVQGVVSEKPKLSPKPDRHKIAAHGHVAPQVKTTPKKPPRKELLDKRWTVVSLFQDSFK